MPYKIEFKKLAEEIDITDVAKLLGLKLTRDHRCACPTCDGDDRVLQIFPDTNSFRCHVEGLSGDCISLYAHVKRLGMWPAAKALNDHFNSPTGETISPTTPRRKSGGDQPPTFDPAAFAANLSYTDEVAALGIEEEDATRLGIGFHSKRKRVYFALRNPDGSVSGFVSFEGAVKLPPTWLKSNVVLLRKKA